MKLCVWQWTLLHPQEMMNQTLTVSLHTVSVCPAHKQHFFCHKRDLIGQAQMFTDESFSKVVKYLFSGSYGADSQLCYSVEFKASVLFGPGI